MAIYGSGLWFQTVVALLPNFDKAKPDIFTLVFKQYQQNFPNTFLQYQEAALTCY